MTYNEVFTNPETTLDRKAKLMYDLLQKVNSKKKDSRPIDKIMDIKLWLTTQVIEKE